MVWNRDFDWICPIYLTIYCNFEDICTFPISILNRIPKMKSWSTEGGVANQRTSAIKVCHGGSSTSGYCRFENVIGYSIQHLSVTKWLWPDAQVASAINDLNWFCWQIVKSVFRRHIDQRRCTDSLLRKFFHANDVLNIELLRLFIPTTKAVRTWCESLVI
jgi:hypothetical protein